MKRRRDTHLMAELIDCNRGALNEAQLIEKALLEVAKATNSWVITHYVHRFKPQGVSGYVLIAEFRISLHTWLRYGYAATDVFTCGKYTDPWLGLEI